MFTSRLLPGLILSATLLLAGCQSSEEKAEAYFQSGMELLAAGDEDRALIEFRNTFKYNGFHKEARKVYADTLYKRGDVATAYSQYLRLIEQYPDTVEVRQILAEIALASGDWSEVERHGLAALALAPDAPGVKAIGLALAYRDAAVAQDETLRSKIAQEAEAALQATPDSLVLRRVVMDWKLSGPDPQAALADVNAALEQDPNSYEFNSIKLRLLGATNDGEDAGVQLKKMVALFPDREELKPLLIRWYFAKKDFDGAEKFLRAEAGDDTGETTGHLAVVQMLNTVRGREFGRAELTRLIGVNAGKPNADLYGAFQATMDFEDGKRDAALAAMKEILAGAQPSDQTRTIMVMYARMLETTGSVDEAKTLVASILENDPTNVDALKMRATWAIADDRPGEAIIDLRSAQSQAPRDAAILTLMAAAYERDGSTDLVGEQLAKAVEVSNGGAQESLRYARFLRGQGRDQIAETVLTNARRLSPGDTSILEALAEIYLKSERWSDVKEILDLLKSMNTPYSLDAAKQLEATTLLAQNRTNEGLALLEQQAESSSQEAHPTAVVVMAQIRAGKTAEARAFLDDGLLKFPKDASLRLLSANLDAMLGETDKAEAAYRALIKDTPQASLPVQSLYGLLTNLGRTDDAVAVLDAGLAAQPTDPVLLWLKAGILEQAGDVDGAIAHYETIYQTDTSNVIAANNLASLITTYRNDPESLERAAAIARRLRGSDEPAFQDTYGWIEYRRGNLDVALQYLEPAAKGLPTDPLTQFHLAMVYADMGRKDEAITKFEQMLDLAKDRDLPQSTIARERIKALKAAP